MSQKDQEPPRVDERLSRLLDIEQRLEERVRRAERAARERVDVMRAAAKEADERRLQELERAAKEQEREDLERHAVELRRIEEQGAAEARKLSALPDDTIERLARRAYARVVGEGSSS